MSIRMQFPSDVNPEPEAKSWRGMAQAFPADPHLSPAPRRFPVPNRPGLWLCAALLAVAALSLSGCGSAEAQPASTSISASEARRLGAAVFYCPGMHADWLDDATVRCLKEKP